MFKSIPTILLLVIAVAGVYYTLQLKAEIAFLNQHREYAEIKLAPLEPEDPSSLTADWIASEPGKTAFRYFVPARRTILLERFHFRPGLNSGSAMRWKTEQLLEIPASQLPRAGIAFFQVSSNLANEADSIAIHGLSDRPLVVSLASEKTLVASMPFVRRVTSDALESLALRQPLPLPAFWGGGTSPQIKRDRASLTQEDQLLVLFFVKEAPRGSGASESTGSYFLLRYSNTEADSRDTDD